MLNFLYCFDKNYNIQAAVSIYSLLEKLDEKINLYIIHQNCNELNLPKKIKDHRNINSLNLYDFKNNNFIFPKVEGAHVSEATYYRFFIEEHLPSSLDYITYMDADIVTINNPQQIIEDHIKELNKSNYLISVSSELQSQNESLKLENSKYFNAGVMLIDYKKWTNKNMLKNLIDITKNRKEDLVFWDQDVLNIYFDGEYLELSKYLNYKLDSSPYQEKEKIVLNNEVRLIHYSGKFKPWSLKGIENNFSIFYQEIFRSLFSSKYHLADNWKVNTLKDFTKIIFSGRIFKISYPISLIATAIKFLISKRK
tara:strand:- start:701 stop:1630 length:930 start_codon:yes stop_codon:yes gene_type:complete